MPPRGGRGTSTASTRANAREHAAKEEDTISSEICLPEHLPFKLSTQRKWEARPRRLKQLLQAERYEERPVAEPTYVNIEAPPSTYPAKKYCDITGLQAPYTDPGTKLRYANTEAFNRIRELTPEQVQQHLALRRATVVLR
mmetsp:Transcript_15989/g.54529  ORF Transcript_15989/g.54529 Transcript_15989/m.54529 type:complete len:141 (-) Transcript_15989:2032-2454(-)